MRKPHAATPSFKVTQGRAQIKIEVWRAPAADQMLHSQDVAGKAGDKAQQGAKQASDKAQVHVLPSLFPHLSL